MAINRVFYKGGVVLLLKSMVPSSKKNKNFLFDTSKLYTVTKRIKNYKMSWQNSKYKTKLVLPFPYSPTLTATCKF